MSIIRTENLSKIYNQETIPVHALNQVSVSFEK